MSLEQGKFISNFLRKEQIMKLEEANQALTHLVNIPFGQLFSQKNLSELRRNKGKAGQLLELALGLHLSNTNLDFEDGELKSNKCDKLGDPLETIFITQVSNMVDELFHNIPFEKTHLFEKIRNILYVPVCKEGNPEEWFFLPSIHVDTQTDRFAPLLNIWQNDYETICKKLKNDVEHGSDHCIHTANGEQLQIRSKDSKNKSGLYNPIFSTTYGRYVSNKNYAFYFQRLVVK